MESKSKSSKSLKQLNQSFRSTSRSNKSVRRNQSSSSLSTVRKIKSSQNVNKVVPDPSTQNDEKHLRDIILDLLSDMTSTIASREPSIVEDNLLENAANENENMENEVSIIDNVDDLGVDSDEQASGLNGVDLSGDLDSPSALTHVEMKLIDIINLSSHLLHQNNPIVIHIEKSIEQKLVDSRDDESSMIDLDTVSELPQKDFQAIVTNPRKQRRSMKRKLRAMSSTEQCRLMSLYGHGMRDLVRLVGTKRDTIHITPSPEEQASQNANILMKLKQYLHRCLDTEENMSSLRKALSEYSYLSYAELRRIFDKTFDGFYCSHDEFYALLSSFSCLKEVSKSFEIKLEWDEQSLMISSHYFVIGWCRLLHTSSHLRKEKPKDKHIKPKKQPLIEQDISATSHSAIPLVLALDKLYTAIDIMRKLNQAKLLHIWSDDIIARGAVDVNGTAIRAISQQHFRCHLNIEEAQTIAYYLYYPITNPKSTEMITVDYFMQQLKLFSSNKLSIFPTHDQVLQKKRLHQSMKPSLPTSKERALQSSDDDDVSSLGDSSVGYNLTADVKSPGTEDDLSSIASTMSVRTYLPLTLGHRSRNVKKGSSTILQPITSQYSSLSTVNHHQAFPS
jgi:hypothetical protein